jgi:hypothetical protein
LATLEAPAPRLPQSAASPSAQSARCGRLAILWCGGQGGRRHATLLHPVRRGPADPVECCTSPAWIWPRPRCGCPAWQARLAICFEPIITTPSREHRPQTGGSKTDRRAPQGLYNPVCSQANGLPSHPRRQACGTKGGHHASGGRADGATSFLVA